MASTRIPVNPANSPVAAELIATLTALRVARNGLNALGEISESAAFDGDFATFNTLFAGQDLPNGMSTDTLYNLIVSARTAINDSAITTLLARVGQR